MSTLKTESVEIAIRRSRLRQWIETKFSGSQSSFINDCSARGYEINQGELSGLLKAKSFGEKKARKLEVMAGMPAYHLNPVMGDGASTALLARETGSSYGWPFKSPTEWEFNNVLTQSDRIAIESMACTLLQARADPAKHPTPATNTTAA